MQSCDGTGTLVGVRVCVRGLRTHFARSVGGSGRRESLQNPAVQIGLTEPLLSWSVRWLALLLAIITTLLDGLGTRVLLRSLLIGYALSVTTISATVGVLYEGFWVARRLFVSDLKVLFLAFGMIIYGLSPTSAGTLRLAYGKRFVLATGAALLNRHLLGEG